MYKEQEERQPSALASILERNIDTLIHRQQQEEKKQLQDCIADRITNRHAL